MNDVSSKLHALVKAYEEVWNTHNAADVAVFFTADADMIIGNSPIAVGRDAIRDWWRNYFDQIHSTRSGEFTIHSMRMITPDVALLNIESTTAGHGPNGEILPARKARGTWVLVRSSGNWLIAALRALPIEGDTRVSPGSDKKAAA
jgi:uncharacterized protein (TIGR02246 family)